jgi:hypothetical protein
MFHKEKVLYQEHLEQLFVQRLMTCLIRRRKRMKKEYVSLITSVKNSRGQTNEKVLLLL